MQHSKIVVAITSTRSTYIRSFLKTFDCLAEETLVCEVTPEQIVAVGCLDGVGAEQLDDYFGVENVVRDALYADGVAQVGDARDQV